jgi:hypothetical protein
MNDVRNLVATGHPIVEAGMQHQVVIALMGLPFHSGEVHTPAFYIDIGKRILESGIQVDSLCLKDASGTTDPMTVYETARGLRAIMPPEMPLWMHTHDTAGTALSCYLAGIQGGVDGIDLSLRPLAGGTSQPDIRSMAHILRGTGYTLVALAALCALTTAILGASRMGRDPEGGLNPWVAALGAVATMGVVIGPLLPVGSASLSDNLTSTADHPSVFVISRIVHLTLIAICGVGGFLLVRTAGLGVMLAPLVLVVWLTASVVLNVGTHPIGPGLANPGRFGSVPQLATEMHTVTLISVIAMTVTALGACGAALIRRLAHAPAMTPTHEPPSVAAQ